MRYFLSRALTVFIIGSIFIPSAYLKCFAGEGDDLFLHSVDIAGLSHIAPLNIGLNQTINVNLSDYGANLYLKQVIVSGTLNTYGGSWANDVGFQFASTGSTSSNFALYPASGQFQSGNGIGVGPATTILNTPFTISNDGQISILLFDTSYDIAGQPDATWQTGSIELTVGQCLPADLSEPYGLLDFFDVSGFLQAFLTNDQSVDINGDGELDFFDISAFLAAFSAGCP